MRAFEGADVDVFLVVALVEVLAVLGLLRACLDGYARDDVVR